MNKNKGGFEEDNFIEDNIYNLYLIFLHAAYNNYNSAVRFGAIKSNMGRLPNTTYIPSDPNTPIIVGPKK